MTRGGLLAWTLLGLAAAGSWWLVQRTAPPEPRETAPGGHVVDYYLEGLDALETGEDGAPARRLEARLLRHYRDDGTTELEGPRLVLHRPDGPPWVVRAERGRLSADGGLLSLLGEVDISRAAGDHNPPLHLRTRDLRVRPRESYLESDAEVSLDSLDDHLQARGLQAWLGAPARLKLLSEVRARYVPR